MAQASFFDVRLKPWIYLTWESEKVYDDLVVSQYIDNITLRRVEVFNKELATYLVDIELYAHYQYDFNMSDRALIMQSIVFKVQNGVIVSWDGLPQMRLETLASEVEL